MKSGTGLCAALLLGTVWCTPKVLAQHEGHQQGKQAQAEKKHQSESQAERQALCPVRGDPINKASYTYYRDRRVYFCCDMCKAPFEKDPGKYADAVRAQWEILKPVRVQVRCPVTGERLKKLDVYVEAEHGRIYFASEDAQAKWQKDSEPFKKGLEGSYTYQTHCPIMDGEINPTVLAEIDGRTVYFCCPGCEKGFLKDKAANFKKLDEQIETNKKAWAKKHAAADKAHKKP